MKKYDRNCLRRKPAIIVLMLTICILAFFNGIHVSAATVDNSAGTSNESTAASNTSNSTGTNSTSTETNSTDAGSTANDSENNINGSLGPLEFSLNTDKDSGGLATTLQMLLVLTVITLAPSILIMVTSFTRIIIVLHFVRSALGTQTTPPNQVLIGLALFITLFIMSPTISKINTDAIQPLSAGKITQDEAFDKGMAPIREFMLGQMDEPNDAKDLRLFLDIAKVQVNTIDDVPNTVLIPAFIISELRKAFIMGFLFYIPFIVIDMVVASTLMSMGMMMLPPTMISMPFKILLFILADGWDLVIGGVVKTFY